MSKRTTHTIRIFSLEVSPNLVLLDVRKVDFHDVWNYWEVTSSQKCPRGPHRPYEVFPWKFHWPLVLLNFRKVDFGNYWKVTVQEDRTDHTNLFRRSFTGSGLTEQQKCQCSWFWEFLEGYFITEVSS